MPVSIPLKHKVQFLELVDRLQQTLDLSQLDWDQIREEIKSGSIDIVDWIQIYRWSLTTLSQPVLSQAQRLLHSARWFVPKQDHVDIEHPAQPPVDPDVARLIKLKPDARHYKNLSAFRREVRRLGPDSQAVQTYINLERNYLYNRHAFFEALDEIYNIEISEGAFAHDEIWSGAREVIRQLGVFGASQAEAFAAEQVSVYKDEYSRRILPYLLFLSENHPEPWARFYALRLIAQTAIKRFGKKAYYTEYYADLEGDELMKLFGPSLRDKDPLIALTAWHAIFRLNPQFAQEMQSDAFLSDPKTKAAQATESDFKLYPGVWGPPRYLLAEFLFQEIEFRGGRVQLRPAGPGVFSINDFHPLHPLRDFALDAKVRQNSMAGKLEYLRALVEEFGLDHKDLIMRLFFKSPLKESDQDETAHLMELPSGRLILRQGHHRVAALIVAAAEGLIPEGWLDEIPLDVEQYMGPIPEALADRVMGRGRWEDIFPQGTKLPSTLSRRNNEGGQNNPPSVESGGMAPNSSSPPAPAGFFTSNETAGKIAGFLNQQDAFSITAPFSASAVTYVNWLPAGALYYNVALAPLAAQAAVMTTGTIPYGAAPRPVFML